MRGITKAIAIAGIYIFSGPNGNIALSYGSGGFGEGLCAEIFVSSLYFHGRDSDLCEEIFPPVPEIKVLWVGGEEPWLQGIHEIKDAFKVLEGLEELIIVGCHTQPFSTVLRMTTNLDEGGRILLPVLQRLTIYVVSGDLDIYDLTRCVGARKEHSRPLEKLTIVFKKTPTERLICMVKPLGEFVGEFEYLVGEAPALVPESVNDGLDSCLDPPH